MTYTDITFLSSRNRGISVDLKLIKNYLCQCGEPVNFRYFVNSELSKNYMVKKGRKNAKEEFIRSTDNVICIDASLTDSMSIEKGTGKRILLALPFDYQFKNMCTWEEKSERKLLKTFKGFTHILAPTPFTADVLRRMYQLDGIQLIEGVEPPFAWQISQPQYQAEVRKQFSVYYPGIEGKKILSILTTGDRKEGEKDWCSDLNLENLLNGLGEEWFVFTNNGYILERASMLLSHCNASFGYVDHVLPPRDVLCFSDILVTNSSMYAVYFAARKKPVYCLKYNDKFFEKYMATKYPDMFLEALEELSDRRDDGFLDANRRFSEELSYDTEECPAEIIRKILVD